MLSELIKSKIDFEINGDVSSRVPNNLNIRIKNKEALALFNQMHISQCQQDPPALQEQLPDHTY